MCRYPTFTPKRLAALLGGLMLGACAVGPDFHRPAAPTDTQYDQGKMPEQVQSGSAVQTDWWQQFGSTALDKLVQEALAANPNLDAAEATLRESEADRRAGAGVFYPNVALGYSAQRQLSSPAKLGVSTTGSIFNLYTLGATIAYQVDLFGGNRRMLEALSANVDEARYNRDAARLALAGNVVDAAIALSAYEQQIDITQHDVGLQQQALQLVRAQVTAGLLPASAEMTQRAQYDAVLASLPALEERRAASRHLLASLMGKSPAAWSATVPTWTEWHVPQPLPLSLPSDLVQQRPDVLAAEARWHAATANVGVATANLFPSITLGADGGWADNQSGNLVRDAHRYWQVGPSINVPLFSGGSDWARRDSAKAAMDVASAQYRQTVLSAFEQVADVLTAVKQDGELTTAREDALTADQQSFQLGRANYQAGTLADADLINIETQLDAAKLAAIDAQAQRLQDAVALYLALGGGVVKADAKDAP